MNKSQLVALIVQALKAKLQVAHSSTQRAIDAATDEETVPEHKYDTLALEAAYLAHGQAMRVQECEQQLSQFRTMPIIDKQGLPVSIGCYVEVEDENEQLKRFFIAPNSGGLCVDYNGVDVFLLTPESPMGKAMMGKQQEDEIELEIAGKRTEYYLVTVC
ncbi:GreA/GreB family elongation factor [Vibrio sp. LaRot3]|uniref:GreA/GreB family elongation factor n=1 Tax=Vibrio sp. LaRot3 TaxID=2998829 RepID=UPI0022CE1348|nr:GreA/GreB family elongation factor [Vibrio sp. LaRot3]MDA0146812.1 GreA/GreB family elongation factor [Vibrio sp. LaRot3]